MLRALAVLAFVALAGCSRTQPEQASGAGSASPAVKELIFNTYLPPGEAMRRISVEDFSKRIEQESNGALKVSIPDSSLAPSNRQWSVVTEGVADLALVATYSQRAQIVLPLLADIPFNSITGESASVALWDTQRKFFDSVNEFSDVKLLSLHVLPPFSYISNVKPIKTVDDFKGLKIWVAAGAPTEAVKALDAIPVYSPFAQLFEYASKGNVDAMMIGPGTAKQASIGDHVKYMTRIPGGMGSASFAVVMNKESWERLSEAEQAAVLRAADGLPRRTGRALDERNRQALDELGLLINEADEALVAELRNRMRSLEAAWVESARQSGLSNAAEALQFYRENMARVAAGAQSE